jgi:hypothetical protein
MNWVLSSRRSSKQPWRWRGSRIIAAIYPRRCAGRQCG